MSLPKINVPEYTLKLPSTDKTINFRPFLVKEEKILLMASMSDDVTEIKNAVRQVVRNCVIDPDFRIESLPIFDIEYILINLRMRSIGNNIENEYVCNNVVDGVECQNPFKLNVDLENVKINKEEVESKIWLTDTVGVKMRWPTINSIQKTLEDDAYSTDFMRDCIEYFFDKENTYKVSEQTPKEIEEFLESLTKEQYDKMLSFLIKMPVVSVRKEHKCEKCGFNHIIEAKNTLSFF